MFKNAGEDAPTTDLFIDTVIYATPCRRHAVAVGSACFNMPKSDGSGFFSGVCNRRSIAAGFNGAISPNSLRMKKR